MLKGLFSFLSQFTPAFLTLVLAGASYWLALQSELNLLGQSSELDPDLPDYYFQNFRSEEKSLKSGQTLVLSGQKAQHIPAQQALIIQQPVAIRFMDPNLKTILSANTGSYQLEKDLVSLSGNAKVIRFAGQSKTTIETEQLSADNKGGLIYSDSMSTVRQPGRFYQSDSFSYNSNSGELNAKGQVKLKLENQ